MAGQGIDRMQGPITCVHIITRMDKGGSAENTFLTLRHLNRDRFKPVLMIGPTTESEMSPKERDAKYRDLQGLVADGITVQVCPYLYRRISWFYDLMAFIWIWRRVRKLRSEIVHTHTSKAGILGRWAAFVNHVPIICHTPHGHIFYGYFGPVKRTLFMWLERLTSRITHRIICLTEGEKADSLRFKIAPEHKLFVCPSGVDLDWIKKGVNRRRSSEWLLRTRADPSSTRAGRWLPRAVGRP